MDVRYHISMVFHLDKCIGCHTCSVACKNVWTGRKGTEYMWWNNVETRPGLGFPRNWEDQDKFKGGWKYKNGKLSLNLNTRPLALLTLFYNPYLPTIDDYYEPWTYDYQNLFTAKEQDTQPTARTISMITGKPIDVQSGPNWDDDLAGSEEYAKNDLNLDGLTAEEKQQLNEIERLVFFYLPRICNHCANASCVAACPSGAIYKRGEDGIILVNQDKCRGWRMCVSSCPYKKVFYNWTTGKSEKCILCYPRLETGQAPACFHTCVGRIRYLGVLLYDADQIPKAVMVDDKDLVESQLQMILDPNDPEVIANAKANGISDALLDAAKRSPVYKFVKEWKIALPLHPEFRTLPMLFYVPPLLPVIGKRKGEAYEIGNLSVNYDVNLEELDSIQPMLSNLEDARIPVRFMANLFSAGNEDIIKDVYTKMIAVRAYMQALSHHDHVDNEVLDVLNAHGLTPSQAEEISRITATPTYNERFVLPPLDREINIESLEIPLDYRNETGFGYQIKPKRGA